MCGARVKNYFAHFQAIRSKSCQTWEETGHISYALDGKIKTNIQLDELRRVVNDALMG